MTLSRLLATTNVDLSTSAAAVTAPAALDWATDSVVVSAEASGSHIVWERQVASDSSLSKMCAAGETSLNIKANPSQTIFYAKLSSGTGTLDVEWWG